MDITRVAELAWLAGIIDGEGYVTVYRSPKDRGLGRRGKPTITVNMTDQSTVARCFEIAAVGNVQGGRPANYQGKNTKEVFRWQACHRNALIVAEAVLPYSVTKRAALNSIVAHYSPTL